MKRLVLGITLAMLAATAQAGILGMLINSRQGTSITGKLVWECTYRVGNQTTTVTLQQICPPTMQFQ
jgi:hypothetical protein